MISIVLLLSQIAFAGNIPTDGVFQRPCYAVGDDTLASAVQIRGAEWVKTHTAYEDENCQVAYLIYETRHQAVAYSTQEMDLTTREVSYTSLSNEVTEALNMVAYCGFVNWKTNQKKIVTGLACDEFQTPKLGEVLYSIFKFQTRADGFLELHLGVSQGSSDGKTSQRRHQGFEPYPYLKTK